MPNSVITHIAAQLLQNLLAATHRNQQHNIRILLRHKLHTQRNKAAVLDVFGLICNVHAAKTLYKVAGKAQLRRHIKAVRRAEDNQHLRSLALLHILRQLCIILFNLRTLSRSLLLLACHTPKIINALEHILVGINHIQVERHACHLQRLAQHHMKRHIRTYDKVRLEADNFLQIRRMNLSHLRNILQARLDILRIGIARRLADSLATKASKNLQIRCIQKDYTLRFSRDMHCCSGAVRNGDSSIARQLMLSACQQKITGHSYNNNKNKQNIFLHTQLLLRCKFRLTYF